MILETLLGFDDPSKSRLSFQDVNGRIVALTSTATSSSAHTTKGSRVSRRSFARLTAIRLWSKPRYWQVYTTTSSREAEQEQCRGL